MGPPPRGRSLSSYALLSSSSVQLCFQSYPGRSTTNRQFVGGTVLKVVLASNQIQSVGRQTLEVDVVGCSLLLATTGSLDSASSCRFLSCRSCHVGQGGDLGRLGGGEVPKLDDIKRGLGIERRGTVEMRPDDERDGRDLRIPDASRVQSFGQSVVVAIEVDG